MRPAGTAPDTRDIIITLITIRFQVSVRKTIKEINCIVSCPCFSVMVKDDRWQSIFTRAKQPHERISFGISFRLLQYLYLNILAVRNHDSGNMETGIPERKPSLIGLFTIDKELSKCQAQSCFAGRKLALHL